MMLNANLRKRWNELAKCVCQGARLMVGVPDYETYVEHMRLTHSDKPVMSYAEFFRERQNARYGGNGRSGFRCC